MLLIVCVFFKVIFNNDILFSQIISCFAKLKIIFQLFLLIIFICFSYYWIRSLNFMIYSLFMSYAFNSSISLDFFSISYWIYSCIRIYSIFYGFYFNLWKVRSGNIFISSYSSRPYILTSILEWVDAALLF